MRIATFFVFGLLAAGPSLQADIVTEASARACALVTLHTPPGPSRRAMALVQVSVYEAVNAISGRYRDGRLALGMHPEASMDAAVLAATRGALLDLLREDRAAVEAWYAEAMARIPEGAAKAAGAELGARAASGVLALRAEDGAQNPERYRPRTSPGVYVPTTMPAAPQWPDRKPWLLTTASQFRPGPPPSLTGEVWARDFNEVKALGGKASPKRSPEQTAVARFWEDNGSGIYFGVLRSAAESTGLDPTDTARLYAVAAMAMDDAIIAVFDAKYAYGFWRPLTAIRNGDQDGNADTEREPAWLPLIDTPMHPEYPCAHCILAASLAEVLEAAPFRGKVPVLATTSLVTPGIVRRWPTPAALVQEVADARVWAGVHYRNSTQVGEAMGRQVGRWAARVFREGVRP
ncbi:MAG TPA: vanadium-dependent haloperoxidase [Holophagaceae bacterium]|nr:vanadium-dependent haloperoxidase [Holophagaceae bacterium]